MRLATAGNHVRFEGKRRHAHHRSRQHRRARSISANTDHDIRPKFANQLSRLHEGPRKIEHSLEPGCEVHPVQRANLDEVQLKSRGRNQPRFDATLGTDKQHLRVIV